MNEIYLQELSERQERFKRREAERKKIEKDLREQIKTVKKNRYYCEDLINDYLVLWDMKCELKHDVESRGVACYWQNSETQYGYKKNDSVTEFTKINTQMLKILTDLGLKIRDIEVDDEDEFKL